jgi:hypothetical protein
MKRFLGLCSLATLLLSASAQDNTPAGFAHWTGAALQHLDQKMHADAAEDPHHFAVDQLADFANDSFLLVHREADGQVEWHETQVDVFFVQSGSASLLLGGKMINADTSLCPPFSASFISCASEHVDNLGAYSIPSETGLLKCARIQRHSKLFASSALPFPSYWACLG